MRRALYWALGLGALSWLASPVAAQQWFFYPTNQPASQMAGDFPYTVPADFPRPMGPPPMAPQPNYPAARPLPPGPMPQTVYYPMPNQRMGQAPTAAMPLPSPAPVQRAAADAAAPMPSGPTTTSVPVTMEQAPSFPVAYGPTGYSGVPASVAAASDVPDEPAPRSGWIGGASVYILKPYVNNNLAFTTDRLTTLTTFDPTTGLPTRTTTSAIRTSTDFEWDLTASPGFWIGYIGSCGIGFRVDYFNFDQRAKTESVTLTSGAAVEGMAPGPVTTVSIAPPTTITSGLPVPFGLAAGTAPSAVLPAPPGVGQDDLSFASGLRIYYVDVEAACEMQLGRCWSLLLTGGGRYLHMNENFLETVSSTGTPAGGTLSTEAQALAFAHNFNGIGPTVAVQARWAHHSSPLAFFTSARGALVVGRAQQAFFFSDSITNTAAVPPISTTTSQSADRQDWVLPNAEIEVGFEYAVCLPHCRPFIRAAAVNQTYFNFGSASRTDTDLALFGAEVSLGVNY
jgi:hypothetical protein